MNYHFYNRLVIRTPLKPLKVSFTKEELKELFSKKEIKEALFLSSPDLLRENEKWQNNLIKEETEESRIINSLLKYAIRMHSRCTPFGLLAGCSVANWGGNYILEENNTTRNTRLDMNFSCALANELSQKSFIKPYLKFFPNSSIYFLNNDVRYIEYAYKNNKRIHRICNVESSSYLLNILIKSQTGATISELAKSLVGIDEITYNEAEEFIFELIDSQILLSELDPSVTGDELLVQLIKKLSHVYNTYKDAEIYNILKTLEKVKQAIEVIDQKIGNDIQAYLNVANDLESFSVPYELNRLFQTDLYKTIKNINNDQNELDKDLNQKSFFKIAQILNKLTTMPKVSNLTQFKERFVNRYETREVSINEALDNEFGIGYGKNTNDKGDSNPLIDDLVFIAGAKQEEEYQWGAIQSFLFQKLALAQVDQSATISITDNEVKDLKTNWDDLPSSMNICYSLIGATNEPDAIVLKYIGSPSGTYLLGRFASGDENINSIVEDIVNFEEGLHDSSIIAQIAHLPESRIGNIISRPALRKYEIPYLSNSSYEKEYKICLDDLYVSVRNNRIVLRSKMLNKEILPRLDNAHNYSANALPIYQFLCDMQIQDKRNALFFDWGAIKKEFIFLPRVQIENIIVSPRIWQLERVAHFKELVDFSDKRFDSSTNQGSNFFSFIKQWKEKHRLPGIFLLVEYDNELLIDLNNELSIKMFLSIIKNKGNIVIKEFFYPSEDAPIKNAIGEIYSNEIVATLLKKITN